jgi:very-short-patch-repair endonuclease
MTIEAERAVWDLARGQCGVVTRAQALAVGWSPRALSRRVRAGVIQEVHRGVYVVGPGEPPGAREKAALLAVGEGALLSHLTAAVRWGLVAHATGARIHVTLVGTGRGRIRGLHTHRVRRLEPDEWSERDGLPLTSPARTLLDVATVVGERELERMLSSAERSGMLPPTTWPGLLARYRGRPGVAALRAVMELPGGPAFTRSEAESAFLDLVRRSALPAPQANAVLGPWEVDFVWRSQRVVAEVDGYTWHRTRRDFERDRARDAWLSARGFRVLRFSWRQITRQSMETAVLLAQALVRR